MDTQKPQSYSMWLKLHLNSCKWRICNPIFTVA